MGRYKLLLVDISKGLKEIGFTKKSDTFYIYKSNKWGLINLQKSKNSSNDIVSFTINIGICSNSLRRTVDHSQIDTKPEVEKCHWNARIGSLMTGSPDFWWQLSNSSTLEQAAKDVIASIKDIVLPAIDKRISDEDLIKEWMEGNYAGTTQVKRYVYLTTLLKLNNDERLPMIIEEFMSFSKGKFHEYTAKEHIKELELYKK